MDLSKNHFGLPCHTIDNYLHWQTTKEDYLKWLDLYKEAMSGDQYAIQELMHIMYQQGLYEGMDSCVGEEL